MKPLTSKERQKLLKELTPEELKLFNPRISATSMPLRSGPRWLHFYSRARTDRLVLYNCAFKLKAEIDRLTAELEALFGEWNFVAPACRACRRR